MKNFLFTLLILGFFYWIAVATSFEKEPLYRCEFRIRDYLNKDSNPYAMSFPYLYAHDTIVIRAFKDSLWDIRSNELCKLIKDSCKLSGYKFLIVDTTTNPADWNTPYGKQIYLRQCP